MCFGSAVCALLAAFVLGIIFAFTLPGWLVILLQVCVLFGFASCLFKKK